MLMALQTYQPALLFYYNSLTEKQKLHFQFKKLEVSDCMYRMILYRLAMPLSLARI